jgi:hypothetical protein
MKGIVHKYDKIIIGATFESLLYALFTRTPVFYVVPKIPSEFESVAIGTNYNFIGILAELKDTYTNQGLKLTRPQKQLIWDRLVFLLSMLGLLQNSNLQSIRIEDKIVKLSTQNSRLITLEVDKILLFDDEKVEGLEEPIIENNRYIIKDYVQFNNLKFMKENYDVIYTDYDTVNQIWFIPPSNNLRAKDGCLISYAQSPEDVRDYEMKFILKEQFKKFNMKGKENGFQPNGNKKYRPVGYTFTHRTVEKEKCNVYQDTDIIKFMNYTSEEILMMFEKIQYREYMLCRKLSKMSTQRRKSLTLRGSYQLREKP